MLYYTYKIEGAKRMKKIVKAISNHPTMVVAINVVEPLRVDSIYIL